MTALVLLKVTLVFAVALLVAWTATRWVAATRHALLVAAQVAVLILPLLGGAVPAVTVDVPAAGEDAPFDLTIPTFHRTGTASPLFAIWLTGVILVGSTKLIALARAAAIVRRARSAVMLSRADGEASQNATAVPSGDPSPSARLRMTWLSDEVAQPSTFGRHIILPASAVEWDSSRLNAVLLHERAHVARRDTLLALLGDAACAVYWFHPLAWLAAHRARIERERACDDAVLAAGVAAGGYASTLIDVARHLCRRSAAAMPFADRRSAPSQLETRIRAILDPSVRRGHTRGALLVAALTLAAIPLVAAVAPFPRPSTGEPDLLDDAITSPRSEILDPVAPVRVDAAGPDAELIAELSRIAARPPRTDIDFVPERARWALTRVRGGELVTPLLDSLHDRDWRVRTYAAWSLGVARDRRATAPLIRLLDEPVWRVRAMAAHALAAIADPAAERAMLAKVDDPAWQVRTGVVKYLVAIEGHDAIVEAMRHDRHMAVRAEAEQ